MSTTKVGTGLENSLYSVGQAFHTIASALFDDVKRLMKSSDGADSLFRFIGESIVFRDLIQRSEKVARPVLVAIGKTRAIFAVSRLIRSIEHLASGKAKSDWKENKVVSIVEFIASTIGRIWVTIAWLVEQELVSQETMASIAAKVGSVPVFGLSVRLISSRVLAAVYLVESLAYAKNNTIAINEGRDVAKNRIERISNLADAALGAVTIIGFANPYPATICGLIAASTAIAAYFVDPANTQISKP